MKVLVLLPWRLVLLSIVVAVLSWVKVRLDG